MPRRLKSKLKLTMLICFTSLLTTSCALQKRYAGSQRHSHSHSNSPSGMINNYKAESQKRDLDNIIVHDDYVKPKFLKPTDSPKVGMWIKYFTGRGKGSYQRYLKNGEKYRPLIERTFEKHGLPKELFFVGLIESGYYIKARSHADAVGPWQFIKSTAKRYGLKVRRDVDERHSIVKSTEAAALFFGDLYNIFGSWELALSAYNAGEYGVIRRIRKARTRDFYELSRQKKLPKETRHYVPKILAAMEVYRNAKKYNISIPVYKNDSFKNIKKVEVTRSTYTRDLAKRYGVSFARLKELNRDLKRNATPSTRYQLVIPTNSVETNYKPRVVKTKRRSNTAKRSIASVKRYRVKKGDNLYSLARKHRTSVSKIVKLNKLKKRTIFIGQRLRLPTVSAKTYTVKKGDFLLKIAKMHKLSISKLKKINSMRSSKIYPGQKLIVSSY